MVRDVFEGIQEALQQDQSQTETPEVVQAPVDHVAKRSAKHPATVGYTAAANEVDDASYADEIYCSAP